MKNILLSTFVPESLRNFETYQRIRENITHLPQDVRDGLESFIYDTVPIHDALYPSFYEEVNGLTIHYKKTGSGPDLVLLHGLSHSWEGMIPIAEKLKKDYTLYIVDLPGFGDTGSLAEYSIEIDADYIHAFLQQLNLIPEAVVGVSMGSMITGDLAYRYPDSMKSSVLIGPVIKNKNIEAMTKTLKYTMYAIKRFDLTEATLAKIMSVRFTIYAIARWMNMYEFNKELVRTYNLNAKKKMRKEAYTQMNISCYEYNLNEVVKKITIPSLLLYGRQDKISSPDFARREILPHNDKLQVADINEAGHVVPLEKPLEVAETIKKFIS